MATPLLNVAGRLVGYLAALLRASLVVAMAVMLLCIAFQVLMRYVFSKPPAWSEEMAVLMFAWATLGGLALGVHEGFHVRLDMLLNALPDRLKALMEALIEGATVVFGGYLAWSGWRFVDVTSGSVSAAIGYPIEFLHALAPITGALICLFATWRLISGRPATEPDTDLAP